MNKVASNLYALLSTYQEEESLTEPVLSQIKVFLDEVTQKLKQVLQGLKERNIPIPEKRGYSLADMALGKLPKTFGQAMTFIEIEQMCIEAGENARNKS